MTRTLRQGYVRRIGKGSTANPQPGTTAEEMMLIKRCLVLYGMALPERASVSFDLWAEFIERNPKPEWNATNYTFLFGAQLLPADAAVGLRLIAQTRDTNPRPHAFL